MNRLGRAVLNSPARASAQRRYVVPAMRRIGGPLEPGSRVLEIGCGRGAGSALIVDGAHSGRVGDGIAWISPIERFVGIRTKGIDVSSA